MLENIKDISSNIMIDRYITDTNKNRLMRIGAGILLKTPKNFARSHHKPSEFGYLYSGIYVYDGHGVYIDSMTGTKYPFSKGDFIQRIPGVDHETNCTDEYGWREVYIIFDGRFFDTFSNCRIVCCEPVLHIGIDNMIEKKMSATINRLSSVSDYDLPYIVLEMQALIYEINQININNKIMPHVDAACKFIRQHCCDNIYMEDVAKAVDVSYNNLRDDFKKTIGMKLINYQQIERIKASVHMLINDKRSIKETAYLSGYANEYIFIKQFTKITGFPPGKYRELYGGK